MGSEMCIRDRKKPIEETITHLREMLFMLENEDEKGIKDLLQDAKDLRDDLTARIN